MLVWWLRRANYRYLSFSISYQVWTKLPCFANLTQRGDRAWKEAQRQGEDKVTLMKTLLHSVYLFFSICHSFARNLCHTSLHDCTLQKKTTHKCFFLPDVICPVPHTTIKNNNWENRALSIMTCGLSVVNWWPESVSLLLICVSNPLKLGDSVP